MADWFPPEVIAELRKGASNLGIYLRVGTVPALCIWLGMNNIPIRIDAIDPDGTIYKGAGQLMGIPDLEVLLNGTAGSAQFTLSGIDPVMASNAIDTMPDVRYCDVHVGLTTHDERWQPMTSIIPIWKATAAFVSESSPTVMGPENPTVTLALTVVTGEPTRSRASRAVWSSSMQKSLSSTDLFCDQTSRLARGVQPDWPNFN